jgi:hypothetical protein
MAFDDFLGRDVSIAEVAGRFETFFSEPENVEVRLAAAHALMISNYILIPQLAAHVNVDLG